MNDICLLMGCACVKTQYGFERCSENPLLKEATACMGWLYEKVNELEVEVKALDDIVKLVKGEHTTH